MSRHDHDAESYRHHHANKERRELADREEVRMEILMRARNAIRHLAPAFPGLRSAHLFGSVLRPGRFHRHSDLDVAVVVDDPETETKLWRALEDELQHPVDVRPLTGPLVDAVADHGEKVYEREDAPAGA